MEQQVAHNVEATANDNSAVTENKDGEEYWPIPDDSTISSIIRVRDYNNYTKTAAATHDVEIKGSLMLEKIAFHDYKELLVETKLPSEEWAVWYADGISLNLHVYNGDRNITVLHQVRVPKDCTVSDLRALAKEKGELNTARVMRISEKYKNNNYETPVYEGAVLTIGSKKLKEDLGIYDNAVIYAELNIGCDDEILTDKTSPCIARYVHVKNSMTIKITKPAEVTFAEETIEANTFWTISHLRKEIATKANLAEDSFRLHKSSHLGVELRLGDETTLSKNYIYNNTTIAIVLGRPSQLGQFNLKTAVFCPKIKVASGPVYYLPEVTSDTAAEEELNSVANSVTANSIALFADVDDKYTISSDAYIVGETVFSTHLTNTEGSDDEMPVLVAAEAHPRSDMDVLQSTHLVESTDVQSLEAEILAIQLPEEDLPMPEVPSVTLTPPRRLSGTLVASLEGQINVRPLVPSFGCTSDTINKTSTSVDKFSEMHTQFITTAADFVIVSLDISVSKETPTAELRKTAFEHLLKYDSEEKKKRPKWLCTITNTSTKQSIILTIAITKQCLEATG